MTKAKSDDRSEQMACPVGRFILRFEKSFGKKSKLTEHLSRSRIEFLKAMKCLIEEKIEDLEKGGTPRGEKQATRIKVE